MPSAPRPRPDFRAFGRRGGNVAVALHGGAAISAPARAAFLAGFAREVDPLGTLPARERSVRAKHLLSAHMQGLAQLSVEARRHLPQQGRSVNPPPTPTAPPADPLSRSNRPYGFEGDRRTVRPEEAKVIREAAQRFLTLDEDLAAIAWDLTRRRIPTVGGGPWRASVLEHILTSARVAGLEERGGHVVGIAPWPEILTPEESRAIRELLSRRSGVSTNRYQLTGLVACGACDALLVSRPRGDGARRYICTRTDKVPSAGRHTFILAEPLEELIGDLVVDRMIASSDALRVLLGTPPTAGSTGAHEPGSPIRVHRILAAYAHGLMREDDATGALHSEGLEHSLRDEVHSRWRAAHPDRRRRVLEELIERIVVLPGRRGYNRFDPERVQIRWRHAPTSFDRGVGMGA